MILFSNPKNLDVRIYGSFELDYNEMIYFFGGNVNGINTNNIFHFPLYFYSHQSQMVNFFF